MEVLRRCPLALPSDLCTAQLLFQLLCWTESLRQCPLHRCWWTTWTTQSKRRPTCSAQLHLPTHDLFWAKLRVQLHLPPLRSLDLLISPGTLSVFVDVKLHWTVLRHWSQFVPDMSTDIRGHEPLHHCHHLALWTRKLLWGLKKQKHYALYQKKIINSNFAFALLLL